LLAAEKQDKNVCIDCLHVREILKCNTGSHNGNILFNLISFTIT